MSKMIKVGDKIEMMHTNPVKDKMIYVSQLLDILEDNCVSIAMPIHNGHIVPLNVNARFDLRFFTENGLYQCKSIIIDRFKSGNIYVLTVRFLSELEKNQRRQYYRLSCNLEVNYRAVSEEELKLAERLRNHSYRSAQEKKDIDDRFAELQTTFEKAIANNISAGGIRFRSNEKLQKGGLAEVRFTLGSTQKDPLMMMRGRVISSERTLNDDKMFEHRLEFVDVDREIREMIVRYVFNEERMQRKLNKSIL